MNIIFAEDVINDPACWGYLDRILNSVEDGWHFWLIDDPGRLEGSEWLVGTNRPVLQKLFEKAAVQTVYPVAGRLHTATWIVSCKSADNTLHPNPAVDFFSQPLMVFVENRYSDCCFLETVLRYLSSSQLENFLSQCQRRPFECDSVGGGGQLPQLINDHAKKMDENGLPPRAVVFIDSDARYPGDTSPTAVKIADACNQNEIPCLVLSKRAIENYIPDEVLLDWARDNDEDEVLHRIEAICRLTPEQRDHLKIKKDKFNLNGLKTEQEQQLFATIPKEDVKILRKPNKIGDDLIKSLQTHDTNLTAETLRTRAGNDELDQLVSMIEQAL